MSLCYLQDSVIWCLIHSYLTHRCCFAEGSNLPKILGRGHILVPCSRTEASDLGLSHQNSTVATIITRYVCFFFSELANKL